jgi:hypothetical protein
VGCHDKCFSLCLSSFKNIFSALAFSIFLTRCVILPILFSHLYNVRSLICSALVHCSQAHKKVYLDKSSKQGITIYQSDSK